MAVNLSIKNVPDALAERLRARALANHRSLQGELMAMLDRALGDSVAEQARAHYATPPMEQDGAGSAGSGLQRAIANVSVAHADETVRMIHDMREERTEHLMRLIERDGALERARSLLGLAPPVAKKVADAKPRATRMSKPNNRGTTSKRHS